MAAIFIKWPGPFEQAFDPKSQEGSIWKLVSVGLVVIKKKNIES